jgi:hypothetical protein
VVVVELLAQVLALLENQEAVAVVVAHTQAAAAVIMRPLDQTVQQHKDQTAH